jgi:hypothetical protein
MHGSEGREGAISKTFSFTRHILEIFIDSALPDLWLKLYWMIHFAFLAFAEGLAVPRY